MWLTFQFILIEIKVSQWLTLMMLIYLEDGFIACMYKLMTFQGVTLRKLGTADCTLVWFLSRFSLKVSGDAEHVYILLKLRVLCENDWQVADHIKGFSRQKTNQIYPLATLKIYIHENIEKLEQLWKFTKNSILQVYWKFKKKSLENN